MIRHATTDDIPSILGMVDELRAVTCIPQSLDRVHAGGFLATLIRGAGLVLVLDDVTGFIAASIERTCINPEPVAVEHGWYCRRPGRGGRLLRRFEAWGRGHGCSVFRMSTAYEAGTAPDALMRMGYRPAEVAWVKRL